MGSTHTGVGATVTNSGRNNGTNQRGAGADPAPRNPFFLYLEGPGDQAVLRSWARRFSRPLERAIDESSVLMGGRQPARAREHFRQQRSQEPAARGVCVLDRDDAEEPLGEPEPGLEFFTWPRRHIESYLLVASAIRRHTRNTSEIDEIERILGCSDLDPVDTHAKNLLSPRGALARELGHPVSAVGVARAMRREEIHHDVHALFDRIYSNADLRAPETLVIHKRTVPAPDTGRKTSC